MISIKLLALETMTPVNSVDSVTIKFSIMVTLTQESEWRNCPEMNERILGRPT